MDYKAEITLNEKDSLFDLRIAEQNLVKAYAEALTECSHRVFFAEIKSGLISAAEDCLHTFNLLKERKYIADDLGDEEKKACVKKRFAAASHELS